MDSLMDGVIVDPMDQQLCEFCAAVLQSHYPGFEWLIEADHRKGFIDIRNLDLHGGKGWRISMSGYATASEIAKKVMLAGGELLERGSVARTGMSDDTGQMLDERQRDMRGNVRMAE